MVLERPALFDHAGLRSCDDVPRRGDDEPGGYMMAASIVAAVPVTVIFVFSQRCFIHGFTAGAVKDKADFPGSVSPNCSVSAASSTFGIRMERAESEPVCFSIPADFRQTAETPYVRCFRCLCI